MININFKNKVVVITGGNAGAGQGIVEAFLDAGATVITTYNKTKSHNEKIKSYKCDQSNLKSIKTFVSKIIKEYKHIDVLVNNAGIYPAKDFNEISEEEFDEMFDVNTKGVFFLTREIAKHMTSGSIINISSINATNPATKLIHYGMSKAAVEMETRCLAYKLGPNIRVNCIAPGLIYKEGQEKFIPGWRESYIQRSALNRLVYSKDVANTAIFLASDLSSAITGQTITVDCGVSLAPYFYNELKD